LDDDDEEETSKRKEVTPVSKGKTKKRKKAPTKTSESNPLAESKCVVCKDDWSDIVYVNCGHLCLCEYCSLHMDAREMSECPMCRKRGGKIMIFSS